MAFDTFRPLPGRALTGIRGEEAGKNKDTPVAILLPWLFFHTVSLPNRAAAKPNPVLSVPATTFPGNESNGPASSPHNPYDRWPVLSPHRLSAIGPDARGYRRK